MLKHLEKMCLDTKFQPFRFRNDKDIDVQIDVHMSNLTFLGLYVLKLVSKLCWQVCTSVAEQTNKVWKFNGDDKELFTEERDERSEPNVWAVGTDELFTFFFSLLGVLKIEEH